MAPVKPTTNLGDGSELSISTFTSTLVSDPPHSNHGAEDSSDDSSDGEEEGEGGLPTAHLQDLLLKAKASAKARSLALVNGGAEDDLAGGAGMVSLGASSAGPSGSLPTSLLNPLHLAAPTSTSLAKGKGKETRITLAQDLAGAMVGFGEGEKGDRWGRAPLPSLSKKEQRARHEPTAGPSWFNLPAPVITPEIKREIQAMRLRNALDPKRFYKGGAKDAKLPEFFALGHVIASTQSSSTAAPTIARKRTFVEELVDDEQAKAYTKKKFVGEVMSIAHMWHLLFGRTLPPPTTIHDLPPETIGHIIKIAYPINPPSWEHRRRREFLLATSLVCRAWTPFAQEALWKHVYLFGDQRLPRFAASGPGRYPVETLYLSLHPQDAASVKAVLTAVRGLRELELAHGSFDARWLCGANMRNLKSLRLDYIQVDCPVNLTLPFNLTTIDLSFSKVGSAPFLDALSRQSTISTLCLFLRNDMASFMDRLSPLTAQIRTLRTLGAECPEGFLRQCTQLKHLTTHRNFAAINHLATSLDSWTPASFEVHEVTPLLEALKSDAVGLSQLRTLRVQGKWGNSDGEVMEDSWGWPRWSAVKELCRKRNIKLIVAAREPT